jgi:hypothetical protein
VNRRTDRHPDAEGCARNIVVFLALALVAALTRAELGNSLVEAIEPPHGAPEAERPILVGGAHDALAPGASGVTLSAYGHHSAKGRKEAVRLGDLARLLSQSSDRAGLDGAATTDSPREACSLDRVEVDGDQAPVGAGRHQCGTRVPAKAPSTNTGANSEGDRT